MDRLLHRFLIINLLALLASLGFGTMIASPGEWKMGMVQGLVTALLISPAISGLEMFLGHRFHHLPFGLFVLVKSCLHTVIIVTSLLISGEIFDSAARDFFWPSLGFAFLLSSLLNAGLALDSLLGGSVLLGLLTGRYYRPKKEDRLFLLADMAGSTALAEKIGDMAFHRLLDRLFRDLSEPVQHHKGSIYRYVGDEMIVTWPLEKGLKLARCLNCGLAMKALLAEKAEDYEAEFGCRPTFRFVLHSGPVVAGEMGRMKREIVYLGDTINTAARLENLGKDLNQDLLISEPVRHLLSKSATNKNEPDFNWVDLGSYQLKGKIQPLHLFTVT
ncbi:adenylate/guanylate cyclase domain-containing protein [Rhodovibrionaceae bacterium A322]